MVSCYGAHSAHPCQQCRHLTRRKREEGRAWYKTSYLKPHPAASPSDNRAESPIPLDNPDEMDEENDAELARLAAMHLWFSVPEEVQQREDDQDAFAKRWCELCFLPFRTMRERDDHVNGNPLRHFTCPFCRDPTIYPTRDALSKDHDCTDRIACRYCSVPSWWPNRKARDEHVRRRHWMCSACKEEVTFVRKEALTRHKEEKHAAVYCHWCIKSFKSEADKEKHMSDGHYKCLLCRIYLKAFPDFERHIATFCHLCSTSFRNPSQLDAHVQTMHADDCENRRFRSRPGENYCDAQGVAEEEPEKPEMDLPEQTPEGELDLYAILRVERTSKVEDIAKAARKRRIETHPDRLERQNGLSLEEKEVIREKAKQVGFAADILTDVERKQKYDLDLKMAADRRWRKQTFGFEDPHE